MAPLTKEEHIARAMLLDMEYDEDFEFYMPRTGKRHGRDSVWLDALTLQPMTHVDRMRRRDQWRALGLDKKHYHTR